MPTKAKELMPAKVMAINKEKDLVRVALFDSTKRRLWLPRTACVLIRMQTWQHIWTRDWSKPRNEIEKAFAALFHHMLMLTACTGRWFVGSESGGQIVTPETVFAPHSFFSPMSECQDVIDSLFLPQEHALVPMRRQQNKCERRRVKCRRRGCPKRGGKKWGRECPLCDVKYCSLQCEEMDIDAHAHTCTMSKHSVDCDEDFEIAVSEETCAFVKELLEDDLFWSNDA